MCQNTSCILYLDSQSAVEATQMKQYEKKPEMGLKCSCINKCVFKDVWYLTESMENIYSVAYITNQECKLPTSFHLLYNFSKTHSCSLQRTSEITFPGSVNMMLNNCVFLPKLGKQIQSFHVILTELVKVILEVPCSLRLEL